MEKENLEDKISVLTSRLIELAREICWNKISNNCEYIISEINESIGDNVFERNKIRKKVNNKKIPKPLPLIVKELEQIYKNLYDINLHIYKSLKNKTIIEIRYFLKTSHTAEYYSVIKTNEPMFHCKVDRPFYVKTPPNPTGIEDKFDVNWELGGVRHEWNLLLGRLRYRIWKYRYDQNIKVKR